MSRTLSGLFLVGALNRPRKRKRTNRESPWTVPEQIGKIPEKSRKSQKGQKRTKKEGQVQIGTPPRLKHPRLAALDREVTDEMIRENQATRENQTICRFARIGPSKVSIHSVHCVHHPALSTLTGHNRLVNWVEVDPPPPFIRGWAAQSHLFDSDF